MSELFYGPGGLSYKVLLLRRCYAIFGGWIDKDKKNLFKQKNKDGGEEHERKQAGKEGGFC